MRQTNRRAIGTIPMLAVTALGLSACVTGSAGENPIAISGSSTVEPITQAMARQAGVQVDIAAEGTADGFDRFCRGETSINNASIPISGPSAAIDYQAMCAENGVEFIELPIALDAVTVVRNDAATFASELSMEQLKELWEADSQIQQWSDLDSSWPEEEIGLYGRPEGSGTRVHFGTEILGEDGQLRPDYEGTDEIDELSEWIADDPNGIGFMGIGNYLATEGDTRRELNNVAVEGVVPTRENTQAGEYALSRPLFIYVTVEALENTQVSDFVEGYVGGVEQMLPRVFYFPLPHEAYGLIETRLNNRTTGTVFNDETTGVSDIVELLSAN